MKHLLELVKQFDNEWNRWSRGELKYRDFDDTAFDIAVFLSENKTLLHKLVEQEKQEKRPNEH